MYTLQFRKSIQDSIISMARSDDRISSAAFVGSESVGKSDKWSDIDLAFGLADGVSMDEVLSEWTTTMEAEFHATQLFDLPYGEVIYRVFLLPSGLQIDLSFSPYGHFGPITDKFLILFGNAVQKPAKPNPCTNDVFGYAVLFALKTRTSLERGKLMQALSYLGQLRDKILTLICLRDSLNPHDGRGFDKIRGKTREEIEASLPNILSSKELRRSLQILVKILLDESKDIKAIRNKLAIELKTIAEIQ